MQAGGPVQYLICTPHPAGRFYVPEKVTEASSFREALETTNESNAVAVSLESVYSLVKEEYCE